jgi:hypothetical protein
MSNDAMQGPEGFIEGLRNCGAKPHNEGGFIIYRIEPVEGRWAGQEVETAVALAEVARWPLVPPHWIHLPGVVVFRNTNSQPSGITGWTQHSRQIARWGQDQKPASGWLSHVRSVVGEAQ